MNFDEKLLHPYTGAAFTQTEKKRLSQQTQACFDLLEKIKPIRKNPTKLAAQLEQLIQGLRAGGKRLDKDASEYQAGKDADLAIMDFMRYWETLSPTQQAQAQTLSADYCVEQIAFKLENLLRHNKLLFADIQPLIKALHIVKAKIAAQPNGSDKKGITAELYEALQIQKWMGNNTVIDT